EPRRPSLDPLSLHDALPISVGFGDLWTGPRDPRQWGVARTRDQRDCQGDRDAGTRVTRVSRDPPPDPGASHDDTLRAEQRLAPPDRKSTRLNSSHEWISYAV